MNKAPAVGDKAPEFELPDSSGESRTLKNLLGDGKLLLVFFRGLW